MGDYKIASLLVGSFIRNGKFPIEADYIFKTYEDLETYYADEINKTTLHEGLLRVVLDDSGNLALYWCVSEEGELIFTKLIDNLSIENLASWLKDLQKAVNQEIADRKNGDKAIYGTDDIEDLTYKDLASVSEKLGQLADDLKAAKSDISDLQDSSKDTDSRLEGIDKAIDNLQKELDLTQVGAGLNQSGSYSNPGNTNYINGATSITNALQILDSKIKETADNTTAKVSSSEGNQLQLKQDGLYNKVRLEYNDGTFTLRVNDYIADQFNINLDSILEEAWYDETIEHIVLKFNRHDGKELIIQIPVHDIIEEWETYNIGHTVILTKEEHINGKDLLSADVNISTDSKNILKKDGDALYVSGDSSDLTHNGKSLESVIKKIIAELEKKAPIDSPILTGIPLVETSPDAYDSSLRIPSTNWVNQTIDRKIKESGGGGGGGDVDADTLKRIADLEQTVTNQLKVINQMKELLDNLIDFGIYNIDEIPNDLGTF